MLSGGSDGDGGRTDGEGGPNHFGGPDVDGETARIVKDRLLVGQLDADGSCEVVAFDLRLRLFQRRGNVVDIGANGQAVVVGGEEAVALGEEILKTAGKDFGGAAGGAEPAVTRLEEERTRGKKTTAVKGELTVGTLLKAHLRPVIREMEYEASGSNGEGISGIEGETINALIAGGAVADVSAEIEVGVAAHTGQGWQAT